jgi:hypothetical protein
MKAPLLPLCALLAGCNGVSFPANSQWPGPTAPAFDGKARFAITNNKSDSLSFIAADGSGTNLGAVPVGDNPVELEGPHHLASSPDGQFIYYNLSNYVPGTGSGPHGAHGTGNVPGSLVKLDARTYEPLGEALVSKNPGDVILSNDGKLAYVSHYDTVAVTQALSTPGATEDQAYSPVAIIDTTTMTRLSLTQVCAEGHGEGLSSDGKTLYVTCALLDQLAVVDVSDPAHPTVTALVPVGPTPNKWPSPQPSYGPYALTVNPVDDTVWISDNNSGDVRVYDPKTAAMDPTKVMVLGDVTMFGAFDADASHFFVPLRSTATLVRIDTKTLQTSPLPTPAGSCTNAHAFVMAPDKSTGVLVCEGDQVMIPGQVVTIGVAGPAILGSTMTGMFSDGAAWLPPTP